MKYCILLLYDFPPFSVADGATFYSIHLAQTHWVCFLLFLSELLMLWNPRLSVVFLGLVRLGSFLASWRQANDTPILKGPPSSPVANYRPIFITFVLSKVFERLVSVHLGRFMESSVYFQPPSLLIGKVWVSVMHFCACLIHCRVH